MPRWHGARPACRWLATLLLGAVIASAAVPGVALASTAEPGGNGGEPAWVVAVGHYVRTAVERVRLWASRDPATEAALAAGFAAARAEAMAGLGPDSAWFQRLADEVVAYLRLAQAKLVEAAANGADTARAVQALDAAVARVAQLPERVGAAAGESPSGTDATPPAAAGPEADGTAGWAAAGAGTGTAAAPGAVSPVSDRADGQPAPAEGDEGAVDAGAAAPEDGAVSAGGAERDRSGSALDEALEAAAEAQLVAGSAAMMEPEEIAALREQGYGYGQIALLYAVAQAVRLAKGEALTAMDVATQLAALDADGAASPEPDPSASLPAAEGAAPLPDIGAAPGTGGEASQGAGDGSVAGTAGMTAAGGAATVIAADTGEEEGTTARLEAFGRRLNQLLALYGIERRDLKPGRWIAAAHRGQPEDDASDPAGSDATPDAVAPRADEPAGGSATPAQPAAAGTPSRGAAVNDATASRKAPAGDAGAAAPAPRTSVAGRDDHASPRLAPDDGDRRPERPTPGVRGTAHGKDRAGEARGQGRGARAAAGATGRPQR